MCGSLWARSLLPVVALVLIASAPLDAQGVSPLDPGTRVRVSGPFFDPHIGTVLMLAGDTLRVRLADRPDTLVLGLAQVTRLEVSEGQHPHVLTGMGFGLLIGAGGGAIAGFVTGDDPQNSFLRFTAADKARILGTIFGVVGALTGGVIGAFPSEDWASVPVPAGSRVSIAPQRDGRLALSFSLAF